MEDDARPRDAEAEEEEKGKRRVVVVGAEQSLEVSEPLTSALGL